jgi:MFS family permease
VLGLDAGLAGLVILSQTLMTAIFSPWAGSLSDRMEPRIPASIGMGITTVGLFFLMFLGKNVPVGLVAAMLGLIGVGFGMFSTPNTTAIMACCDKSQYGIASSFVNTSRNIGQSLSMAIVTVVMAFVLGDVKLGPEHSEALLRAFRITFGIFTGLCILGTYASYARGNIKQAQRAAAELAK